MQLKKIDINCRDLFLQFQPKNGFHTQYMSFTNLFLWKDSENIEYFCYNDVPIITGTDSEKKRYFMVPENFCLTSDFVEFLTSNFENAEIIVALTNEQALEAKNIFGNEFEIFNHRDMDNYIYLSEKLSSLSGKKLHSKKNHVNNFKKLYNYEFCELNDENTEEITAFLEKWYEEKIPTDESLLYEKTAVFNGLKFRKELQMKGAFIKVDEKIVAFTMGDQTTSDMAVIHFEKANTEYKGAYAMINYEFVNHFWKNVTYINREDDMGIEGLRKSKLSYHPYKIKECYSMILKEKKDE